MNVQDSRGRIRWVRLVLAFFIFLILSIGLGYIIRQLFSNFRIPLDVPLWTAMLIIFGVLLVMNVSFFPLPFGVALMLVASSHWNPVLVALAGSLGASVGESSGYFFGALGKKLAIHEKTPGYQMVQNWINRYGMWAIAFVSFQPIIPFELGGFIAGVARMPFKRFLPAIMIGKFPKYLILVYAGNAIIHIFPAFRIP
jgi:uncharacterized membrane protein YdjX (TVP38/TMEM64 family)